MSRKLALLEEEIFNTFPMPVWKIHSLDGYTAEFMRVSKKKNYEGFRGCCGRLIDTRECTIARGRPKEGKKILLRWLWPQKILLRWLWPQKNDSNKEVEKLWFQKESSKYLNKGERDESYGFI